MAIVAGGIMSSLLYSQRLSESNLSQSYAAITAQSIIEQIVRLPADTLKNESITGVTILIPFVTDFNKTEMERISVPWSASETEFTEIGPEEDPSIGILLDAAYIAEGHQIRPDRYMRFRVNLQRTVEESEHRIGIVLRYQWAVPDQRGPGGAPVFLENTLTTFRSTAVSF